MDEAATGGFSDACRQFITAPNHLEPVWHVHAVEFAPTVVVGGQHDLFAVGGQGRAHDPADSPCQAVFAVLPDVVEEQVVDAVPRGHEEDPVSRGQPLGPEVVGCCGQQRRYTLRVEVVNFDVELATPFGTEGQAPSVRAEAGLIVSLRSARQLRQITRLDVDDVDVALAEAGTDEGQSPAVRRPVETLDNLQVLEGQRVNDFLVVQIPEHDDVGGAFFADEGDGTSVGRPGNSTVVEGQVFVDLGAHPLGQALDETSVAEADDVHVLFDAIGAQSGEHVAAEGPGGGHVETRDIVVLHHSGGKLRDIIAVLQQGPVLLAHVRLPALVKGLHVHVE